MCLFFYTCNVVLSNIIIVYIVEKKELFDWNPGQAPKNLQGLSKTYYQT